jgi:hypothetical protein
MLKNGGGGIVNTASVAGLQGLPTAPLCRSEARSGRLDQNRRA